MRTDESRTAKAEPGLPSTEELELYRIYKNVRYLSIKHQSYFHTYTGLFESLRGREIVFVEIGVLNGGSLFMWREYFGKQARIIGVDLNPEAVRWRDEGFEIHIGSQADPAFWKTFFAEVGTVDVILDDGGHTNRQQIVTVASCLSGINDGGMLIVEDVHTSYLAKFGNPSRYSFINFAKHIVDAVNSRCSRLTRPVNNYWKYVSSVAFHESVVVFRIDRRLCEVSHSTSNSGESLNAKDYRFRTGFRDYVLRKLSGRKLWNRLPIVKQLVDLLLWIVINRDTEKYFR
jgi:hypothetical protein